MLEIVAVVLIGRYFYKLAEEYDKSKWLFPLIGIVTFYGTYLVVGFFYGIYLYSTDPYITESDINPFMVVLLGLPIGIGAVVLLYKLLESNWKKNTKKQSPNIDEIGKS